MMAICHPVWLKLNPGMLIKAVGKGLIISYNPEELLRSYNPEELLRFCADCNGCRGVGQDAQKAKSPAFAGLSGLSSGLSSRLACTALDLNWCPEED